MSLEEACAQQTARVGSVTPVCHLAVTVWKLMLGLEGWQQMQPELCQPLPTFALVPESVLLLVLSNAVPQEKNGE